MERLKISAKLQYHDKRCIDYFFNGSFIGSTKQLKDGRIWKSPHLLKFILAKTL